MLTRMKQVPHSHFRMPGTVRTHTTVYTVALAMALAAAFDLRRIAALGAIFSRSWTSLSVGACCATCVRGSPSSRPSSQPGSVLDIVVLGAFVRVQASSDALSLYASAIGLARIVFRERLFMRSHTKPDGTVDMYQSRAGRTADIGVSRGLVAVVEGHRGVGQRSVEKVSAAVEMVFDG